MEEKATAFVHTAAEILAVITSSIELCHSASKHLGQLILFIVDQICNKNSTVS